MFLLISLRVLTAAKSNLPRILIFRPIPAPSKLAPFTMEFCKEDFHDLFELKVPCRKVYDFVERGEMMDNTKINAEKENLRDVYKEIAEKTDIDTAHKIYCAFAGVQVCFPKKFYRLEYVKSQICTQYAAGISIKELTRRYNYSERWIRKILNENR